ncbi:MAG TPA: DUF1629 domain-containing protein [Vicinamibacterales bacterium]|jgi:hypothetical protein|nr:DUF1629 domain-containing protein [Vicinamibacterales bacterium]
MPYFTFSTLGDTDHEEYCFSDNTPDGIDIRAYRLSKGLAMGTDYPADSGEVRLRLGEDYPGLKRASFIGNTGGFLAFDRKTADVILSHNVGRVERLPFVLLDHKGRLYSRDYVFLNPLERVDCLNLDLSVVRRAKDGEIRDIKKLVLKAVATPELDLFRLGERPRIYLFSSVLVAALKAVKITNVVFTPVELR